MSQTPEGRFIAGQDDLLLITGATGFIGSRLVEILLERGFRNLRCLIRPSSDGSRLEALATRYGTGTRVDVVKGNLLSPVDCAAAAQDAAVIYHLATSRDGKSYPDAFMNTVVTTRNLLDVASKSTSLRRFVNISSLAVYSNRDKPQGRLLDEACPVEPHPELRGDAYCFAKVRQDEIVIDYGKRLGLPYVIVRPGYVYGPGKDGISSRVGIGTFGLFLHMGGWNTIPLTYIDNCADAIALAGLQASIENDVFNIVDDDLPSSRQFLREYKRHVKSFRSLYMPHGVSYALCYCWERYSAWSEGQLPPAFNRKHWHVYWKRTRYSNQKLKARVGWSPRVPTAEGFRRCFEASRNGGAGA